MQTYFNRGNLSLKATSLSYESNMCDKEFSYSHIPKETKLICVIKNLVTVIYQKKQLLV
jgi:hypothetical protein